MREDSKKFGVRDSPIVWRLLYTPHNSVMGIPVMTGFVWVGNSFMAVITSNNMQERQDFILSFPPSLPFQEAANITFSGFGFVPGFLTSKLACYLPGNLCRSLLLASLTKDVLRTRIEEGATRTLSTISSS